ncbi:TPA: hypothetical protein ACH3X2_003744 [Trebouxia sp. C0005]
MSLADLIPSMKVGIKEEDDMQPVVTELIQAVMHAVNCDCLLKDTHTSSEQFENPASKPETEMMYGQQVERCRAVLDSFHERQLVVAVNVTMNTFEVMTAERQPGNNMRLSTTGRQPFSISQNSAGFQLLVQLLSTPKANLGYATPLMPAISKLGQHCLKVQYLINQGTAHQGSGSRVFGAKLEADRDAILKLSKVSQEGDCLSQLKGEKHVIELPGTAQCDYNRATWHAILVAPMVQRLNHRDDPRLFGQVLFDIASSIGNAAKKDIAQRDVTPNNFGHWKGRGYLYDFSAAKGSSTSDGPK